MDLNARDAKPVVAFRCQIKTVENNREAFLLEGFDIPL